MFLLTLSIFDISFFKSLQTSLCNTAIDNPTQKSRENLTKNIIHYLETDTVRFVLPLSKPITLFSQRHLSCDM